MKYWVMICSAIFVVGGFIHQINGFPSQTYVRPGAAPEQIANEILASVEICAACILLGIYEILRKLEERK